MKLQAAIIIASMLTLLLCSCVNAAVFQDQSEPQRQYVLKDVHQVNGRQGVCTEGDYYWVSGSKTLTKYDKDWNVVSENTDPFKGYELEVNHIGDIDVYNNEIYLGVEYFMDGESKNIQGVAYYDGSLYVTADDGDADKDEPDHMYRIETDELKESGEVFVEKVFDDVILQGEIEGLSFDAVNKEFLLLYNRGARIIAGMPSGFYDGYTEEIHEVFVYDIN